MREVAWIWASSRALVSSRLEGRARGVKVFPVAEVIGSSPWLVWSMSARWWHQFVFECWLRSRLWCWCWPVGNTEERFDYARFESARREIDRRLFGLRTNREQSAFVSLCIVVAFYHQNCECRHFPSFHWTAVQWSFVSLISVIRVASLISPCFCLIVR